MKMTTMKNLAALLCLLLGAAALSYYPISFLGGKAGSVLTVGGGLPAPIVPFLISLASLGALLLILLVALIRKRDRVGFLLCAGLGLVLFVLPFLLKPEIAFQAGLRTRITSQVSPEELRAIATTIEASVPEGERLPGPMKKSLWSEDYRESWEELVRNTAIDQLDPGMVITHRPESVEITWGGARSGHWGVSIDTGTEGKPGDIAPGIRTYLAED